ncbi:MAG TPA: DUF1501 domain-containing protein [Planctomycetota bacterium]
MTHQHAHDSHGLTRRTLLGGTASLVTATAFARPAHARGAAHKPTLIQVFLRGGMDGLTAVVPHGDGDLYVLRPTLAVPPPGAAGGALDLDGFFGLPPAAAPLLTPYGNGHLAIVHAMGSTDVTRSHFEAMETMEFGDPSVPPMSLTSGWGARYLVATAAPGTADLRGLSIGNNLPTTLRQAPDTLPVRDFTFDFPGRATTAAQRQVALLEAYARRHPLVAEPAFETIASFNLGGVDFAGYVPENGAVYPAGPFGDTLRNVAALLKADTGVEFVNINNNNLWDLHAFLGPLDGLMASLLSDLARGLEAFYLDMLGHLDDYLLFVVSEFGRHAPENGSGGVDHGRGNAMFVLGDVNGGQVIADWPGLSPAALDFEDLAVTIDYRDVLGELLLARLGVTDLAPIFPGHLYSPRGVVS